MTAAVSRWIPLLEGSMAQEAWEAVLNVAKALEGIEDWESHGPSLSGGSAGAALFFGYLAKATGDAAALATCRRLREETAGMLASRPTSSYLFGGFAGIGWAETHLDALLDPEAEDPAKELDEELLGLMDRPKWCADYDLISGLVGFGVYGLERLEKGRGRSVLEAVLDHLEALKELQDGSLTWFTPPELLPPWQRELAPEGYWNLGLAHGVPGVIALLSACVRRGVRPEFCLRLLEGSVTWLRSAQNPEGFAFFYGSQIPKNQPQRGGGSRVAWCYGDLGVAAAYFQAGCNVGRLDWMEEALTIARASAKRPRDRSGVVDSGVCHGAAGNALIFHRFYMATEEECFRQAALDYLAWTLEWQDASKPFGGFPRWKVNDDNVVEYQHSPGLLEGSCGVAMVLLAALTDLAPDWDRHLLVSIAPRSQP